MSDQRQQEVLHDTVIPKYSTLSDTKPSRMLLIGVWLIFLPMTTCSAYLAISQWWNAPNVFSAAVGFALPFAFSLLCGTVLYKQTKRCCKITGE